MPGLKNKTLKSTAPGRLVSIEIRLDEQITTYLQKIGDIPRPVATAMQAIIVNSFEQMGGAQGNNFQPYHLLRDQQDRDRAQVDRDRTENQQKYKIMDSGLGTVTERLRNSELHNASLGANLTLLHRNYQTLAENHETTRKDVLKVLLGACSIIFALGMALVDVLVKPETSFLLNFFQNLNK